jgi:hypothetical protein
MEKQTIYLPESIIDNIVYLDEIPSCINCEGGHAKHCDNGADIQWVIEDIISELKSYQCEETDYITTLESLFKEHIGSSDENKIINFINSYNYRCQEDVI